MEVHAKDHSRRHSFAQRLGIRILWIDSISIIRDEERDWREHAAAMASCFNDIFSAGISLDDSRMDISRTSPIAPLTSIHNRQTHVGMLEA